MGESLNESWDKEVGGGVPQSAREAQGGKQAAISHQILAYWAILGPPSGLILGWSGGPLRPSRPKWLASGVSKRCWGTQEGSSGGRLGTILGHFWATSGAILGRLGGILGRLGAILGASWAVLERRDAEDGHHQEPSNTI